MHIKTLGPHGQCIVQERGTNELPGMKVKVQLNPKTITKELVGVGGLRYKNMYIAMA